VIDEIFKAYQGVDGKWLESVFVQAVLRLIVVVGDGLAVHNSSAI
jgi:hypothetical protein